MSRRKEAHIYWWGLVIHSLSIFTGILLTLLVAGQGVDVLSVRIPCQAVEHVFIHSWGRRSAKGLGD